MFEEITNFSKRMNDKFELHFPDKTESYKECDIKFLINKFREEEKEVRNLTNKIFMFNSLTYPKDYMELRHELLDLSLMCMMLDYRISLL